MSDPVPGTTATVRPSDGLRLRGGPSLDAAILETMPQGTEVTLTGGRQNGFVAATHGGQNGWAFSVYLATADHKWVAPVGRVKPSDGLRLRSGPSTDAAILETMPVGTVVALTDGSENGFLAVSRDGRAGWAFAEFLLINPETDEDLSGWDGVNQWVDAIQAATAATGVSVNLIKAIMRVESNGDPGALGAADVVGLMQINTAVHGHGPWDNNNAANILKGAQLLLGNFQEQGTWDLAIRAYHGFGFDGITTDLQYLALVKSFLQQLES